MQTHKFVEEFKRANAGKTVNVYYMGLGGTTFSLLASATLMINNSNNQTYHWNIPRPIAWSPVFTDFLANANQTGSGPAIVPDCVAIFENGGNDAYNMDGASMHSLINQIRAISHADDYGPPDIVLQTDHQATTPTTSSGNSGGVVYPGVATRGWYYEYSAGLIRTTALAAGYGCVDLGPLVTRTCFGYDPVHRAMRGVPSMAAKATPSSPLVLPYRCGDFSFWFSLPGSSDAAVWRAMRQLDFQVSINPGNKVMLRYGANGNLWVGVSTWGQAVATTCTIARGGTLLTVGSPVAFTGVELTQKRSWPQLGVNKHIFDRGMAGKCIVTPTRRSQTPQRNFIQGVVDAANLVLHENSFYGSDIVAAQGSTLTVGGVQFIAQDSNAQPDVAFFYPDGTIWNTRVADGGYVSLTQGVLASPAPQALAGQTIPVFIGRMGVKWFDTGLNLSGVAGTGTFEINVNRGSLILMHMAPPATNPFVLADIPIERFGGGFYPVVKPQAPQQIQATNIWIDTDKAFQPVATPWEIRGIADANGDFYLGGAGGHPSSRLRTDVTDFFYQNQNLCTY